MASRSMAVALVVALAASACGKRGSPLPPLRPVPARVADLTASRTADRIELRFTVPAANLDGTRPPAIDRVDIYGWPAPVGVPPLSSSAIVADGRNLRSSLAVRRTADLSALPVDPLRPAAPLAGEQAVVVDTLTGISGAPPVSMYYVVVPVAGSGRGRRGPPSAPAVVPFGAVPSAPTGLVLSHNETEVRAVWDAGAPGHVFRVMRVAPTGTEVSTAPLVPVPPTQTELGFPVEFGRETCVAVQAVQQTGPVSVAGELSRPVCLTPVDRYAPGAPGGLQIVQEGTAVTVIWSAVEASDLAGYVVLRGSGSGADLQPLMRTPIREATFRDTTVQPGVTYTYAVYAVDSAPTPNISQLSPRQSVTVR